MDLLCMIYSESSFQIKMGHHIANRIWYELQDCSVYSVRLLSALGQRPVCFARRTRRAYHHEALDPTPPLGAGFPNTPHESSIQF